MLQLHHTCLYLVKHSSDGTATDQGSDTRVCTQKTQRVYLGGPTLKNPVKNPPILILYLTFIVSYQLDNCIQITMSAMHNTNRMLNTTV